jgi:hypothetical protein
LLVEESRTNLVLHSEEFDNGVAWSIASLSVTSNDTVAPNGTTTADLLTNTATTAVISQSITKAASAITYTGSAWVKSTVETGLSFTIDDGVTLNRGRCIFNLTTGELSSVTNDGDFTNTSGTITPYPNSWYRITITTTTNTQTTARLRAFFSGNGDSVYLWGAQLEAGSFPTSYIPTEGSTVTRAADVVSISGSNFSGWYDVTGGTVLSEFDSAMPDPGSTIFAYALYNDSGNLLGLRTSVGYNPDRLLALARSSGSTTFTSESLANGYIFMPISKVKNAFAFNNNDFAVSWNGASAASSSSGALSSSLNKLFLGSENGISNVINGHIRRLTYWPQRLPNETLQTITQ